MSPLDLTQMDRVELVRDEIGLFCLAARINGAEATLLVDSGATHTILDRASAERRGLQSTARPDDQVAGVGTFAAPTAGAAVVRLQLAALDIEKIELMVVDLEEVCRARLHLGACAIDGILGADLLSAHRAAIVFGEPALYVARNGNR